MCEVQRATSVACWWWHTGKRLEIVLGKPLHSRSSMVNCCTFVVKWLAFLPTNPWAQVRISIRVVGVKLTQLILPLHWSIDGYLGKLENVNFCNPDLTYSVFRDNGFLHNTGLRASTTKMSTEATSSYSVCLRLYLYFDALLACFCRWWTRWRAMQQYVGSLIHGM